MTEVRLTASQRRALDWQKENLVIAAEELLTASTKANVELTDSQLRNLSAIAGETESPAVVINYIRYQMGRDKKHRRNWARLCKTDDEGASREAFGNLLIKEIKDGAVEDALKAVDGLDGVPRQLARIQMLRHFLGFMSRHLKYLQLQQGGDN